MYQLSNLKPIILSDFLLRPSLYSDVNFSGSSRILQARIGSTKKNAAGQVSPTLVRRGSGVSRSGSCVSVALSGKDDKMSIATMGKDEKGLERVKEKIPALKDAKVEQKNEKKSSEIQVIPVASPEILQPLNEGKLLPQRSRSSNRLVPGKQPPKSAVKKRVPLDVISCISDYSVVSSIDFQPRNMPSGKQSRQGGTSLLTSKSLKDFTNSPEGKIEISSVSVHRPSFRRSISCRGFEKVRIQGRGPEKRPILGAPKK